MAEFVDKKMLCFDDVLLMPQYSDLNSRSEADIGVEIVPNYRMAVPIISANMDSITEVNMAKAMFIIGGMGILHRYATTVVVLEWLSALNKIGLVNPIPSIGVKDSHRYQAELYRRHTDSICVDIAHGNSEHAVQMVKFLSQKLNYKNIIAGNVATLDGVLRLSHAGANIVKCGIGGGSVCSTRINTGHGIPQLSAVLECSKAKLSNPKIKIISDGGIRNSGDIVKSLAAGADAVMVGGMLAGCDECPLIDGKRTFRGMASKAAQMKFRGNVGNDAPEGVEVPEVNPKGSVVDLIKELVGGIRSGLSYSGVRTIKELQENAKFIEVSSNCVIENGPHALRSK